MFKNKLLKSLVIPAVLPFVIISANCENKTSTKQENDTNKEQNTNASNQTSADNSTNNQKIETIQNQNSYDYKTYTLPSVRDWTNINNGKLVYDNNSDYSSKYYSSLNGLKGEELFNAIFNNQKKYVNGIKSYGDLYKTYETAFIDRYFEKDGTILDIYSEVEKGSDPYEFPVGYYEGTGSKGSLRGYKGTKEGYMYNREHMIPQSWFNKVSPTRNDAHFVWPSDKQVNNDRGNDPHYYAPTGTQSANGTKVIKGTATEPIDLFKGDTARAYFYFQATHQNALSKGGNVLFTNAFPYFQKKYLDCYEDWSKKDPVDLVEVDRNNAIARNQGGLRNPFIDYPELVELIWGKTNKTFVNRGVLVDIIK
ncbi:endonuclease [Mycoplasmopsis felifaucium]|uniref:Endonuclease n=1 Tax=Mycoplasmopsis felifaucium TaxID=35768 RepID=A0ABZ2RPQ8_9BACT